MTEKRKKGLLPIESYLGADLFWIYFVQMAVWTPIVSGTIDAPLISVDWLVAYVDKTAGAGQVFIFTTLIGVNIWRYAMKFFQERVRSVKEQVAEGEKRGEARGMAEATDAIITKLRRRGMSENDISDIVNGTVGDDGVSNGAFRRDSDELGGELAGSIIEAMGRMTAASESLIDAANRIAAASEKSEGAGEAEKPNSRI